VYYKHPAVAIGILMGVLVTSQGCQSSPPPVFSDTRGTHFSEGADIQGYDQAVQAILSLFKKAEDAVLRKDLDGLMVLYSEDYKHGGYTKDSVRAVWSDLFIHYHDFSATHIFSKIKVEAEKTVPQAHVTCTGSLWAMSNETGQRVNIDSWYGEVHHLTFEPTLGIWLERFWRFHEPKNRVLPFCRIRSSEPNESMTQITHPLLDHWAPASAGAHLSFSSASQVVPASCFTISYFRTS